MGQVRQIAAVALAQRAKAGLRVRQPLNQLEINNKQIARDRELSELIKQEVNVKRIIFGRKIKLDTKITEELKNQGLIRDLIRFIQGMRKDTGLKPGQLINLYYSAESVLDKLIKNNKSQIKQEVSARELAIKPKTKQKYLFEKQIDLDKQKIWFGIKK